MKEATPERLGDALFKALDDVHRHRFRRLTRPEGAPLTSAQLWAQLPPAFRSVFGRYVAVIVRLMFDDSELPVDDDRLFELEERRRRLHNEAAQLFGNWLVEAGVLSPTVVSEPRSQRLLGQVLEDAVNKLYVSLTVDGN